jgi:hypothetical protein
MKKLFLLMILSSLCFGLHAQQFSKAVGIRCGYSSGFEYRFYNDIANSYKILLSTRDRGLQLTILKEFHRYDVFDFSGQLEFIYGIGVHAGYEHWNERHYTINQTWYDPRVSLLAGLDGLAAVEYTFNKLPFSAGMEVKPFFDVGGRNTLHIGLFDFALTCKYLF